MWNISNDYDGFTTSTKIIDDGNDNVIIIFKLLFLSFPGGVLLLSLVGFVIWSTPKPLLSKQVRVVYTHSGYFDTQYFTDKELYPSQPDKCIITAPSEIGKKVFLTNINSKNR